ncbi:hypothetical protein ON010_g17448 [Phytophthora cinnamomi]|nr:hypothetical protein ON010_g17448 [Phytophthora cinnamomi]
MVMEGAQWRRKSPTTIALGSGAAPPIAFFDFDAVLNPGYGATLRKQISSDGNRVHYDSGGGVYDGDFDWMHLTRGFSQAASNSGDVRANRRNIFWLQVSHNKLATARNDTATSNYPALRRAKSHGASVTLAPYAVGTTIGTVPMHFTGTAASSSVYPIGIRREGLTMRLKQFTASRNGFKQKPKWRLCRGPGGSQPDGRPHAQAQVGAGGHAARRRQAAEGDGGGGAPEAQGRATPTADGERQVVPRPQQLL